MISRATDPKSGRDEHRCPPRVLLVDDDAGVLRAYTDLFVSMGYATEAAADGVEALHRLRLGADLVVLDAEMPYMDGFQVAKRIRELEEGADVPILMITGYGSGLDRARALGAGVDDFLTKPFDPVSLRLRSESLVALKAANDRLRAQEEELETVVREKTEALQASLDRTIQAERRLYDAHIDTIRRLVSATGFRDAETGEHVQRIGRYSAVLGRALELSPGRVELLRHAAPLHDLGKLGVPDRVLEKPGTLDTEEWALMERHPEIGWRILDGSTSDVLQVGAVIALTHHERWDGTGYPNRTKGEEIPLEGRICAVADVFDALTTHRPYRVPMSFEGAIQEIRRGCGTHFDPDVVAAFHRAEGEILREFKEDPHGH